MNQRRRVRARAIARPVEQMAAVVASVRGWRVRFFGADLPLDDLVAAYRTIQPFALGLSVSSAACPDTAEQSICDLCRSLAADARVVVGGAGAAALGAGMGAAGAKVLFDRIRSKDEEPADEEDGLDRD